MNKKSKKLDEITDGDPIKILEFLEKNKNIRLKYESSYEDRLFQLKNDKEFEVDGPFSYIDGVIEYSKDVISLPPENNKYKSAVDVFNNWEEPQLENWAGGNFNPRKPVYWGECFIYSSGYIDVEGLIEMLREFITEEDETDEDFRDEGFHWFLDSLGLTSDPEEFHVAFEDNEIDVTDINYTVGTELGLDDISFYSTKNMVHTDYEFIVEYDELNWVFEPKDDKLSLEEPLKINSNTKKSHYLNGNIEDEIEFNEQGERHGLFRRYHENGELQVEVNFTNGIQDDSEIISYHDDGSKARLVNRVNSSLNGEFFEWFKNGQLKKQGVYNEEVPTIQKEWDENGDLI